MNTQDIQTQFIRTLHDASGHPLLEDVLRAQVETRLRPRPTKADLDEAIDNLKRVGFIVCKENEMDGTNPYWLLGERGEAHALKMGL
jgi:hypothetical protein